MPSTAQDNKGSTNAQSATGGNSASAFKQTVLPRLRGLKGGVERGSIWLVRIIESGQSLNGPIYPPEALRASATVFEGAPVFLYKWGEADPRAGNLGHLPDEVAAKDDRGLVGNMVGSLESVHFNEEAQALDGYLKVYDAKLRERMLGAYDMGDIGEGGQRDVFGLSIDAAGDKAADGVTVQRITTANSVDLVTTPAAGGRIRRLVAAVSGETVTVPAGSESQVTPNAPVPAAHLTEADVRVGNYKHPEFGDGWAVFVAGAPTDWYPTSQRDRADRKAEIKTRLVLTEAQTDLENKMPTTILKENAATIAAELKRYADMLTTAADDEAMGILQQVMAMVGEYAGGAAGMEMATGKHSGQTDPYGNANMPGGPYLKPLQTSADSDQFARMAAGVREALQSPAVQADAKLKESLETALGEKLEEDARDATIRQLQETLREQAIGHAAHRLAEELGIHDLDGALVLIDRTGVRVSEDFKSVEGLKEAFETLIAAKPHFGPEWSQRQTEAAVPPEVAAVAAPAAAPAAAEKITEAAAEQPEALGQNVPMRESVQAPTRSLTPEQAHRRLAGLKKSMLKGSTKAAVQHRNLKSQMRAAGLL